MEPAPAPSPAATNDDQDTIPWTHFHDMHSGGGLKHGVAHIFIEAPVDEAKLIFFNRFGTNPERVTCTCCGEDYSIDEEPTLAASTAYQRHLLYASPLSPEAWRSATTEERQHANKVGRYMEVGEALPEGWTADARFSHDEPLTLDQYLSDGGGKSIFGGGVPLVIYAKDIAPEERNGSVPEQGYVWQ